LASFHPLFLDGDPLTVWDQDDVKEDYRKILHALVQAFSCQTACPTILSSATVWNRFTQQMHS
jgi:hypothetical protein